MSTATSALLSTRKATSLVCIHCSNFFLRMFGAKSRFDPYFLLPRIIRLGDGMNLQREREIEVLKLQRKKGVKSYKKLRAQHMK